MKHTKIFRRGTTVAGIAIIVLSLASSVAFAAGAPAISAQTLVPQSDDFNPCGYLPGVWTEVLPGSDGASISVTGTSVKISVPGGTDHSIYGTSYNVPRLMQKINDIDFGVEVKILSAVTQKFQTEGIVVEQDDASHNPVAFLRAEFHFDSANTRFYVAYVDVVNGVNTKLVDEVISPAGTPSPAPLFMRVQYGKSTNTWIFSASVDGSTWVNRSFTTQIPPFTPSQVGIYAGNAHTGSGTVPAHVAEFDTFFNLAAPISPLNADNNSLTINKVGSGTVTLTPEKSQYQCGDTVTLTAITQDGATFNGWSGDLTGSTNPTSVTMNRSQVITANFSDGGVIPPTGGVNVFLPSVLR